MIFVRIHSGPVWDSDFTR